MDHAIEFLKFEEHICNFIHVVEVFITEPAIIISKNLCRYWKLSGFMKRQSKEFKTKPVET